MKIEGSGHNQSDGAIQKWNGKEATLQNRLRVVQQELSRLGQKEQLTKEEQEKKQKLEKEQMELEQQLQDIAGKKQKEVQEQEKKQEQQKIQEQEETDSPWKEEGKGERVDERV